MTILCMVLGSSSVPELVGPGKTLRWAALFVLAAIALRLAARDWRASAPRPPVAALGLGAWLALVAIASTAWSVDSRLTLERAGSLALLFVAAGGFAVAARRRPDLPPRLLQGVLAGAAAAGLAGLLVLAWHHGDAVQAATDAQPPRFQGLGENPDTMAMLEGVATPVALWALLRARSARERLAALALVVLFLVLLSASGSRGGLLAAFAGSVALTLTLPFAWRRRLVLSLAVVLALFAATAGTRIPKPLPYSTSAPVTTPGATGKSGKAAPPQVGQALGVPEQRYSGRLADELYRNYAGTRSVFTSSGRLQAWYTAIQQADARPLLGYGFGTENRVFLDRIYNFDGSFVENSFIGLYLQLGAVGLASLLALLGAVVAGAWAAIRRGASLVPSAVAGVVVAGVALMLVQSYVYSVGNVATVTFWVAGFLVAGIGAGAAQPVPRLADGEVLATA